MIRRLYLFLLGSLALLATQSHAQLGGSSSYNFLKIPNSARVEALGGHAITIMDQDASLAIQNPALLNHQMHRQITLDFNSYLANIGAGYAGYAHHWKKIGTFHAGMQFFSYGDFTEADQYGNITGKFSAADYALTIGYARPFFDSLFYIGANYKMIYSQLAEYNSFGMALDLGATYRSKNKLFTASLVMRNIGAQLDPYVSGKHEPVPFEMHLGISQEFKYIPLRLMLTVTNLQRPDLSYVDPTNRFQTDPLTGDTIDTQIGLGTNILRHFVIGAELAPFKKRIFLRVSYNFLRSGEMSVNGKGGPIGLSYGIGIRISKFTFSYARSEYHIAGSPNHITLQINLDQFIKGKRVVKSPLPDAGAPANP